MKSCHQILTLALACFLFANSAFATSDYDQAVEHITKGEFGKASIALFKSTLSDTSLPHIWENLSYLEELQRRLGIRNSVFQSVLVELRLLSPYPVRIIILLCAVWFLLVYAYVSFRFSKKRRGLIWTSGAFFLICTSIELNHWAGGKFAVLTGTETVSIFRTKDKNETLVQLPEGTIGIGTTTSDQMFYLEKPIAGWIQNGDYVAFNTALRH